MNPYLWIKALHVMAVIAWMAGLFYLPRLFVYHARVGPGPQSETFKVMEEKLLRIIMRPAMMVSWATGLYLATAGDHWREAWFHAKLALVVAMTAAHHYDAILVKRFAADANSRPHVFYRYLNEVPTLLMMAIVALVIVKPF
ncbi:protoporphyrinogen oxidase HemJ [Methylocystis parvus]|uniref:Protoporphyrinogen IX oxidase n=1 Tax=Methylocystis parvus TaxID=134 RepID=A0A6B8M6W6_9HYPH|nr:protoporphyrinogen oxidase HemJ [Methylocystis parvus]QGM97073.1 protoporphyrinogen oxidase HemJ [Methylocystis parvus]WBJ99026.1 protoporphyrinogen oxidase HemJ [Methylocystis parvus OBBP]